MMSGLMASCMKFSNGSQDVEGWKPVYISKDKAFVVTAEGPRDFASPGKMFLYQNLIFVTDNGEGVHIIDNTDPAKPKKVAFVSIPGVVDAAVKDGILFADNFTDLVAVDVRDVNNITFAKRVKDVYPIENQLYPEYATGYFECVDTTKGYVQRWVKTTLHNPKCYR